MSKRIVQFYLFRHGETDWNREGRFQGHTDIPLNDEGRRQAEALSPLIERIQPQLILSSDLSRAYETAAIAVNRLNKNLKDPIVHRSYAELREAHLGQAEGLTYEEIIQKLGPETLERWRSSQQEDLDFGYPGGETGKTVIQRVLRVLETVIEKNPSVSRIAVCSHGGVIRRVLTAIAGSDLGRFPISNGILYQLEFNRVSKQWRWIAESDWRPFSEDLVITHQGELLSNDEPILHERTRLAFLKNLKSTANGYRIQMGAESIRVHVESTPYFIKSFYEENGQIWIRLSDQSQELLDCKRFYAESENDIRYRLSSKNESARFLGPVYHAFMLRFLNEENGQGWIVNGEQRKRVF